MSWRDDISTGHEEVCPPTTMALMSQLPYNQKLDLLNILRELPTVTKDQVAEAEAFLLGYGPQPPTRQDSEK